MLRNRVGKVTQMSGKWSGTQNKTKRLNKPRQQREGLALTCFLEEEQMVQPLLVLVAKVPPGHSQGPVGRIHVALDALRDIIQGELLLPRRDHVRLPDLGGGGGGGTWCMCVDVVVVDVLVLVVVVVDVCGDGVRVVGGHTRIE